MKSQEDYLEDILYVCDAEKNITCRKHKYAHGYGCQQEHGCHLTSHKEFSKDGIPHKLKDLIKDHAD